MHHAKLMFNRVFLEMPGHLRVVQAACPIEPIQREIFSKAAKSNYEAIGHNLFRFKIFAGPAIVVP